MAKKVAINFWSIFNRYEGNKEGIAVKEKKVSKELLNKIKSTKNKIIIYENAYPTPSDSEGGRKEPEFQEMIVEAIMQDRLEKAEMPFDEVSSIKPKDIDIEIDYQITEHKNWEKVLIEKLKNNGD